MKIDQIYNNIANNIIDSIPEDWEKAQVHAEIVGDTSDFEEIYYSPKLPDEKKYFESSIVTLHKNFHELHNIMTAEGQHNWNRATFTLYPDGNFDIDFKYDEDLAAEIERLENEPDERFDA